MTAPVKRIVSYQLLLTLTVLSPFSLKFPFFPVKYFGLFISYFFYFGWPSNQSCLDTNTVKHKQVTEIPIYFPALARIILSSYSIQNQNGHKLSAIFEGFIICQHQEDSLFFVEKSSSCFNDFAFSLQ